jgi:hypothetical protein
LRVEYLAGHASHLPRLAEWHHAEFGYLNPANTVQRYVERLTASLQRSDLPSSGIASALVGRVERAAAEIGSEKIYLFTPSSEKLYASLGWELMEYSRYQELKIAIMSKTLAK